METEGGELYITLHRLHSNNSSFRWAAIIALLLFQYGVNCEGQSHKTVSTVSKGGWGWGGSAAGMTASVLKQDPNTSRFNSYLLEGKHSV